MRATGLTKEALGIFDEERPEEGYRRVDNVRQRMYTILVPSWNRWYAPQMCAFTVKTPTPEEADPECFLTWLPKWCLPSIWKNNRNGLYTIRVPSRLRAAVRRKFAAQGYFFDTRGYYWDLRKRRKKRSRKMGSSNSDVI